MGGAPQNLRHKNKNSVAHQYMRHRNKEFCGAPFHMRHRIGAPLKIQKIQKKLKIKKNIFFLKIKKIEIM
jgi:hypothetical protein